MATQSPGRASQATQSIWEDYHDVSTEGRSFSLFMYVKMYLVHARLPDRDYSEDNVLVRLEQWPVHNQYSLMVHLPSGGHSPRMVLKRRGHVLDFDKNDSRYLAKMTESFAIKITFPS